MNGIKDILIIFILLGFQLKASPFLEDLKGLGDPLKPQHRFLLNPAIGYTIDASGVHENWADLAIEPEARKKGAFVRNFFVHRSPQEFTITSSETGLAYYLSPFTIGQILGLLYRLDDETLAALSIEDFPLMASQKDSFRKASKNSPKFRMIKALGSGDILEIFKMAIKNEILYPDLNKRDFRLRSGESWSKKKKKINASVSQIASVLYENRKDPDYASIILASLWKKALNKRDLLNYYEGVYSFLPSAFTEKGVFIVTGADDSYLDSGGLKGSKNLPNQGKTAQEAWLEDHFKEEDKLRKPSDSDFEAMIYWIKNKDNHFLPLEEQMRAYPNPHNKSFNFPDCGATSARNFVKLMLDKKGMTIEGSTDGDYDTRILDLIGARSEVKKFFEEFSTRADQKTPEARNAWARITCKKPGVVYWYPDVENLRPLPYSISLDKNGQNYCEIATGRNNMLTLLNRILLQGSLGFYPEVSNLLGFQVKGVKFKDDSWEGLFTKIQAARKKLWGKKEGDFSFGEWRGEEDSEDFGDLKFYAKGFSPFNWKFQTGHFFIESKGNPQLGSFTAWEEDTALNIYGLYPTNTAKINHLFHLGQGPSSKYYTKLKGGQLVEFLRETGLRSRAKNLEDDFDDFMLKSDLYFNLVSGKGRASDNENLQERIWKILFDDTLLTSEKTYSFEFFKKLEKNKKTKLIKFLWKNGHAKVYGLEGDPRIPLIADILDRENSELLKILFKVDREPFKWLLTRKETFTRDNLKAFAALDPEQEVIKFLWSEPNNQARRFRLKTVNNMIRDGDYELARILLAIDLIPFLIETYDLPPLLRLVHAKNQKMLDLFIKADFPADDSEDRSGHTALMIAVKEQEEDMVFSLLQAKGSLLVKDRRDMTAFRYALKGGNEKIIQAFLDLDHEEKSSYEPKDIAYAASLGRLNVVKSMIAKGVPVDILFGKTALESAAEDGHFEVVKFLVSAGAKLNFVHSSTLFIGDRSFSGLRDALSNKHYQVAEFLLDNGASLEPSFDYGNRVLEIAIDCYESIPRDLLFRIIDGSKNINFSVKYYRTPFLLHSAIQKNLPEVIQKLIEKGADLNAQDKKGRTPLALAVIKGQIATVQKILNLKVNVNLQDNKGDTALMLAVENGQEEMLKLLLQKDGIKLDLFNYSDNTALMLASKKGCIKIVEMLLRAGADVNLSLALEKTALIYASEEKHIEVIDLLLGAGANINFITGSGMTALTVAIVKNNEEVVEHLLNRGAFLNIEAENPSYKKGALFWAIKKGNPSMVQLLLKYGADVDLPDSKGRIPLMTMIEQSEVFKEELMIELAKKSTNLNVLDEMGRSLLILARKKGLLELSSFLESRGVVELFKDEESQKEFIRSLENGTELLLASLYERKVDFSATLIAKEPALIHYVKEVDLNHLRAYCMEPRKSINLRDKKGNTALILAAKEGHLEKVKLLLSAGAGLNYKDNKLNGVLHYALVGGHLDIFSFLLDYAKSLNLRLDALDKALLYAVKKEGYKGYVELLLEYGVNPNVHDDCGRSALILAARSGFVDIIELMTETTLKRGEPLDLNIRDQLGSSAMIHGIQKGHVNVLEFFIESKVNLNHSCHEGFTPLVWALWRLSKNKDEGLNLIEILIDHGADVNISENRGHITPLAIAQKEGLGEAVQLLESLGAINFKELNEGIYSEAEKKYGPSSACSRNDTGSDSDMSSFESESDDCDEGSEEYDSDLDSDSDEELESRSSPFFEDDNDDW